MPPKPRPVGPRPSTSQPSAPAMNITKLEEDARAMPPPPNPPPLGILVPEITALNNSLKNVALKTGQLYAFHAETRKLGIEAYADTAPGSLTAALGRETEIYDQLCDTIEARLLRAITVLQRDLAREERRVKEAEEAAAQAEAMAHAVAPASQSPGTMRAQLPTIDVTMANPDGSPHTTPDPNQSPPPPGSAVSRRPSVISISSLQRPNLPLKLDLSANSLRISPEEASLFSSSMASPVTLAPRSARSYGPNEYPPDFIAALASASASSSSTDPSRVDIDLTGPTLPDAAMAAIGNSADQPIELDLESMEIDMAMTDLFGDAESGSNAGSTVDDLFTPVMSGPGIDVKTEESFLDALNSGSSADIFGAESGSGQTPLPNALLASFAQMEQAAGPSTGEVHPEAAGYDLSGLDLSGLGPGFFGDAQNPGADADMGFDMAALLGTSIDTGDSPVKAEPAI